MGEARRFRRYHFFVNRKLQIHFAASASFLILISTISIWVIMNWMFSRFLIEGTGGSKSGIDLLFHSNCMMVALILADTLVVFLLSIYFSHYVAGPIVHFERILKEIIETKKPRTIILRKNDLLQETAYLINEMVKTSFEGKTPSDVPPKD